MRRLARLWRNPQEVNFFLFLALFALVIGVIYWFASYEAAGTVLLIAFGLANGVVGVRLAADPASALVRRRAAAAPRPERPGGIAERVDAGGRGPVGEGTGEVSRPFLDERGRLPGDTLAPFAVGLGVAVAVTGAIFGLAPVLVGLIPLAWGAWTWLAGASAELEATEDAGEVVEAGRAAGVAREDGRPVEATPGRATADR